MLWDNKNTQQYVWNSLPDWQKWAEMRKTMRDVMLNRDRLKEESIEKSKSSMLDYTYKYDDISHNSANDEVKKSSRMMGNFNWIAYMIYSDAINNWYKDIPNEPESVMAQYRHEHPDNWETIVNAVKDENLNLEDFWIQQWWVPSEEDDEVGAIAWTIQNFFSSMPVLWNSLENQWNTWRGVVANFQDWFNEWTNYWSEYEKAVIEWVKDNLAFAKFWKPYGTLSTKQQMQLVDYFNENPEEVIDKYRASWWKSFFTLAAWETDALFTATYPVMKGAFSVADEIPYVRWIPQALWAIIQLWWWILDEAVDLWLEVAWLPTIDELAWAEEYADLADAAVWSRAAIYMAQNPKVQKWTKQALKPLVRQITRSKLKPIFESFKEKIWDWAYTLWEKIRDVKDKIWWWIDSIKSIPWKVGNRVLNKWIEWIWKWVWKLIEWYDKVREESVKTRAWDRFINEVVDPILDEYINKWWDLNKEIPAETDLTKIDSVNKANEDAAWRLIRGKDKETAQKANNTLDRLDPEKRSKVKTWKELNDLVDEEVSNWTMEIEDTILDMVDNISKTRMDELSSWKTSSWRKYTNRDFLEWLQDLLDIKNIEYELEPVEWAEWEFTIKLKNETPTKSQAEVYDLVDEWNSGNFNAKNRWNWMRQLNHWANLVDENWKTPKRWTSKNDVLQRFRWIKKVIRDYISEDYPEFDSVLKDMDIAYWEWESFKASIKAAEDEAFAERTSKQSQTDLQKELSQKSKIFEWNILKNFWKKILNNEKITADEVEDNLNFLLKQHYDSSKKAWRTWWDKFRETVKKIKELKSEREEIDNNTSSNRDALIESYTSKLSDVLSDLWISKDMADKIVLKQESLFKWQQEPLFEWEPMKDADIDLLDQQINNMMNRKEQTKNVLKWTKSSLSRLKKWIWK